MPLLLVMAGAIFSQIASSDPMTERCGNKKGGHYQATSFN